MPCRQRACYRRIARVAHTATAPANPHRAVTTAVPDQPKLYHIVHVDRLPSIIADGHIWSDARMACRDGPSGTTIGMNNIKDRRLTLRLSSHDSLHVGECVPFYFCPRSVMLYIISQANHSDLTYRGGQEPIVHLEIDLHDVVAWANQRQLRWCFTSSNAGSFYFNDYADLAQLNELNWRAISARQWAGDYMEAKQAEFLVERQVAWQLVNRIGVRSGRVRSNVLDAIAKRDHRPIVEITSDWYY